MAKTSDRGLFVAQLNVWLEKGQLIEVDAFEPDRVVIAARTQLDQIMKDPAMKVVDLGALTPDGWAAWSKRAQMAWGLEHGAVMIVKSIRALADALYGTGD